MSYVYEPYGPFEIQLNEHRRIDKDSIKARGEFWQRVEATTEGLSTAHGCYLFSVRAGRGIRPWYVGQAKGKHGFRQEVFQAHKLLHMNEVLARIKKGTPIIHLLARRTPKKKFSVHVNQAELNFLETLLIGMALNQNEDICNIKNAKRSANLIVPGVTGGGGRGRLNQSRSTLRTALGL